MKIISDVCEVVFNMGGLIDHCKFPYKLQEKKNPSLKDSCCLSKLKKTNKSVKIHHLKKTPAVSTMQTYSQSSYSWVGSDSLAFVGKNVPVHREFVYFYLAASPFVRSCARSNQVLLGFSVALREPRASCNLYAFAQRMVLLAKVPCEWVLTLH